MLNLERSYNHDFRRQNRAKHIHIAEHNEQLFKERLLDIQNTCLPTLNKLRSHENISQLQERVYQKITPYVDRLNICLLRSRTADEADYCFTTYDAEFQAKFKPELKDILLHY